MKLCCNSLILQIFDEAAKFRMRMTTGGEKGELEVKFIKILES